MSTNKPSTPNQGVPMDYNEFRTTIALIEFFSARYRERKQISNSHPMIEAKAFEALAQLEFESHEAQLNGNKPLFDSSKEKGSGFSANEPVPFKVLATYISVYLIENLKDRIDRCGELKNLGDGMLFKPGPAASALSPQIINELKKLMKKGK